jgi:hypothetical protein
MWSYKFDLSAWFNWAKSSGLPLQSCNCSAGFEVVTDRQLTAQEQLDLCQKMGLPGSSDGQAFLIEQEISAV